MVQDIFYEVTALLLAWRYHKQQFMAVNIKQLRHYRIENKGVGEK